MARGSDIPPWAASYIGIPFADCGRDRHGVDCWGLVRLVLRERFGLEIPSYDAAYFHTRDFESMQRLLDAETKADCWEQVMERYDAPGLELPGDVVLMRVDGLPVHVGVVIAPGQMLHACDGMNSVRERFDRLAWKNRVIGIYRHRALAAQG